MSGRVLSGFISKIYVYIHAMVIANKRNPVQPPRGAVVVVRICLTAATIIAGYLAWIALSGQIPIGCGPDSGCDKVLQSRWAKWFGMSVSIPALPVYLTLLAATFSNLRSRGPQSALILSTGALLLIGAAVWFVILQAVVVRAFCAFCMTAHVFGVIAALIILVLYRPGLHLSRTKPATVFVLVLLGLIAGQTFQSHKTHVIIPAPVSHSSQINSAPPTPSRLLQIYGGAFQLKVGEVPLFGSPSASNIIVSLFDYTCHHCRIMHGRIMEAQRTFADRLAVVSLPMPMDPKCNHTVKQTLPDHTNACEYARIGLGVWRAKPARLATYDDWVFAPERPPPVDLARQHAIDLVGLLLFETAIKDPWIETQLQQGIAIYEAAYRAGQGSIPQIIIGNKVAVGDLPMESVYQLLDQELGLKAAEKH